MFLTMSRMQITPLVSLAALCVVFLPAQLAMKLERDWQTLPLADIGSNFTFFKPGQPFFRILSKINDDVYIGGNETLLKLTLVDNEVDYTEIQLVTAEPELTVTCDLQNPMNNENVCWNFIRVAEMTSSGELFVCGTNAFSALCYRCSEDLSTADCTVVNGTTLALVPKSPSTNPSTAVLDDELYAGSVSEDTFQRYNVSDLRTNDPVKLELETVTAGEGFIKDPTFVGKPYEYTSDDGNEYVFIFYRETALEYDNHGEKEYSRIARVCKNDTGGRVDTTKFVTFIKARLNCSIPDELLPFYFDDIQDVTWDETNNEAYAVFTTPELAPSASALCRFRMEDIMKLFDEGDSKQQEESNSLWLPKRVENPRPGTCTANYDTIDYPPLLDKLVPNYNPFEPPPGEQQEPPPANFNASNIPTLYVDGVRFTSLAVDFDYDCVYFFGTTLGAVIKVHKEDCSSKSEPFTSVEINELVNGTSGPVTGLELLTKNFVKHLVITTEDNVVTWPLNTDCSTQSAVECQDIRYPYCMLNGTACTCATLNSGCQDGVQPTTVQPTTDQLTTTQVTTDQPTTDQPTTDQPTTDQPTTTQVTTDQPTTDQPTTAQPTTAQATTDQLTTEQPLGLLEIIPPEPITSCYNEDVYVYCHMNCGSSCNLTWPSVEDELVQQTTVRAPGLVELKVTLRNRTAGVYNCTAELTNGTSLTAQVEINQIDCITERKLQDRCDERDILMKENDGLQVQYGTGRRSDTCSVETQDCEPCPP